jgi:hypothetical protein
MSDIRARISPALFAIAGAGCLLALAAGSPPSAAAPQTTTKILEVDALAVQDLTFLEPTGQVNSAHLSADGSLEALPSTIVVSEHVALRQNGVQIQAGAAWFPPLGGRFPAGKGRSTQVHWEVLIGGEVSATGTFSRAGVPSLAEWDDWFEDEGPYPHGQAELTNETLRMAFDLTGIAEAFDDGSNDISLRLSGSTYVWRNGWTPDDWMHTPTEKKYLDAIDVNPATVGVGIPYSVWKDPTVDGIVLKHPAFFTVVLWCRNDARAQYGGNQLQYENPTIVTAGGAGTLWPVASPYGENQRGVRSRSNQHEGTHPPDRVRVLPDFAPISIDVFYRHWDLRKNGGRVYASYRGLPPTVLDCVQDGQEEEAPGAPAGNPFKGLGAPAVKPKRSAVAPGPRAKPGEIPFPKPVNDTARSRIVSLLMGQPTLEFDASADENDQWLCHECLTSGDEVEIQFEYRDIFGRYFADTIALTVPDSFDLDAPDTLELRQPLLELVAADQVLDPIIGGELVALDLASAAFGILRPVPGLAVADQDGDEFGDTDDRGRVLFAVPQETVLRLVVTDPLVRFLPLALPATPPLHVHLTHHEIEPGQWRDNRMVVWLTPGFADGRLHAAAGRIDDRDGVLVPRIGAVSDIGLEDVLGADWETLDGEPVAPAAVGPWGATPRDDLGYLPALFALSSPPAGPPGDAKSDPAFQAALQAIIAAGGARLHVATADGRLHSLDVLLEPGGATSVEPTTPPAVLALQAVPNPFNPGTTLSFDLPRAGHVRLEIYRIDGQRVATLIDGALAAGPHSKVWSGRDDRGLGVASGIYLARLSAAGMQRTQKIVMVR